MATFGVSQACYVTLQAYLGAPDYSHQTAIDFVAPSTLTGATVASNPVNVPGSTSYQAVALATLFPALSNCVFISVADVSTTPQPFSVSTANGTGSVSVVAGGFFAWMPNSGAPPTIYLSNANTGASNILISIISN